VSVRVEIVRVGYVISPARVNSVPLPVNRAFCRRVSRTLVAAQVALAIVLLAAAGLLAGTLASCGKRTFLPDL